jgi:hypothetical protein
MSWRIGNRARAVLGKGAALLTAVMLIVTLGSCSDANEPTGLHPATPRKNISLTDWYSCWRYVSQTTWTCEYTGTTASGNAASSTTFTDMNYQPTSLVEVTQNPCARCAREPAPPAYVPQPDQSDTVNTTAYIPNCNVQQTDVRDAAWCAAKTPTYGSEGRATRIEQVLATMSALGPPCDRLAGIAYDMLTEGHIRVYHDADPTNPRKYHGGGFASLGQGQSGYMLMKDVWVDVFFQGSAQRAQTVTTYENGVAYSFTPTLQFMIAHEMDHLIGNYHTDSDRWLTPNAKRCGGL